MTRASPPYPRSPRRNTRREEPLQRRIIKVLRLAYPKALIFGTNPVGIKFSFFVAKRMKDAGILKGTPDIVATDHRGTRFLEVKPPKGGHVDEAQEKQILRLREWGIVAEVVHSEEEALAAMEMTDPIGDNIRHGMPKRRRPNKSEDFDDPIPNL